MTAYKLTDEFGQTKNNTQWGPNVTHKVLSAESKGLCSTSWIHYYTSPLIAVLMNPSHANFTNPQLWECSVAGEQLHEPLKSGTKELTTIKQIDLPLITHNQKVAFGILSTLKVYSEVRWVAWANNWLENKDRSIEAAANNAASYAIYAANAANNAANAASSASYANISIDFLQIANKALTY